MLVFVAVCSKQISAIDRAVDDDFALFPAAKGADFFAFGWTESLCFSFFADWAGHDQQNTLCGAKIKSGGANVSAIYGPMRISDGVANGFVRTCSGRIPMPRKRAGNWRSHG